MKLGLLAALVFLVGCAAPRPYPSRPIDTRGTTYENRGAIIENRDATYENRSVVIENPSANTIGQDAYECEREAVLSNVAGGKAEAFNSCMRTRGHTPNR